MLHADTAALCCAVASVIVIQHLLSFSDLRAAEFQSVLRCCRGESVRLRAQMLHRNRSAQQKKTKKKDLYFIRALMQNVSKDFYGKKRGRRSRWSGLVKGAGKGNRKKMDACKQRREGSEVKLVNRG